MAVDFSWMDDLLSDDTDYGYLFDDSGDGAVNLDFDYDPSNSGITSLDFDVSSLFGDDDYSYLFGDDDNDSAYSYLFGNDDVGPVNLDFDYTPGVDFEDTYKNLFDDNTDYSYLFNNEGDGTMSEDDYEGIFGLGVGPKLKDFFLGTEDSAGFLGNFLGGGGNNKKSGGSSTGLAGLLQGLMGGGANNNGLFGGSGLETIIKLAMINKLRKQDRDDPNEVVPIGSDAFAAVGQGQGLGTMPDYRTFNIQPALMPGVGYANAPPPGMKQGGVSDGPGDITLARLEPGEFVMTRKATDNIGAKNLYKLMKDAERMN